MGRIEKAICNYLNKHKNKGNFYKNDFTEILSLSADKYEMIFYSLIAGYEIGYKAGRKEEKKGRAKNGTKETL